MKPPVKKNLYPVLFVVLGCCIFSPGCASPYLKGITSSGQKVYLGPVPIESTEAYQNYLRSPQTEVDKQNYLFMRLKDAVDMEYYHDGNWYDPVLAYRGGKWLMRNRYKEGQDSREFIRKYIERSETTGQYHLAKYPDGSVHIGSYILYNELDLLEETARKDSNAVKASPAKPDCGEKCAGS
jgi:hypothetical protein